MVLCRMLLQIQQSAVQSKIEFRDCILDFRCKIDIYLDKLDMSLKFKRFTFMVSQKNQEFSDFIFSSNICLQGTKVFGDRDLLLVSAEMES